MGGFKNKKSSSAMDEVSVLKKKSLSMELGDYDYNYFLFFLLNPF